jgi:hypothetical protein
MTPIAVLGTVSGTCYSATRHFSSQGDNAVDEMAQVCKCSVVPNGSPSTETCTQLVISTGYRVVDEPLLAAGCIKQRPGGPPQGSGVRWRVI